MTHKYNAQELLDVYTEQDRGGVDTDGEKTLDAVWQAILASARMNLMAMTYKVHPVREGEAGRDVFAYVQRELTKVGNFKCERIVSHAYQCACHQELGCYHWIVVEWNRDDLLWPAQQQAGTIGAL
jgi:hypothetical protein